MFLAKSAPPLNIPLGHTKPLLDWVAQPGAVTLFTTPPGYLLTESLAGLLAGRVPAQLWLRFGPEDRDPATLVLSFINASRRRDPKFGAAALKFMQEHPGPVAGWPRIFTHLAAELAEALPPGSVLVLEHIHQLNGAQPALGLLGSRLLAELSPRFHFILISHERLPASIFPPQTISIGVRELRLDSQAGLDLAHQVEIDLPDNCIRRAVELIEGRIGALSGILTACSSLGQAFIQQTVERSKNADHLLAAIARASLAAAEPHDFHALALALQLNYCHPALLDAGLGSPAMPAGPWIQPLADDWERVRRLWYRPLKSVLPHETETDYAILRRVGGYLAQTGAVEQAVQVYFEAGDAAGAAQIIAGLADNLLNLGQWETLRSWLERLPAPALHDHPRLLYVKGELEAARGEAQKAGRSFSLASALFLERSENAGACQSLLAQSTLEARQGRLDRARSGALSAAAIARAAGLPWHQGWANWQLGCLAVNSGEADAALAYFSQATQTINDPLFNGLFQRAQALLLQQRRSQQESTFHRQAYERAGQAEQAAHGQLHALVTSPFENLPALLGAHGWSHIPLLCKLPAQDASQNGLEELSPAGIWQTIFNALGFYRFSRRFPGAPLEAESSSFTLPSALEGEQPGFLPPPGAAEEPPLARAAILAQPSAAAPKLSPAPVLTIHLLGTFRVYYKDFPVEQWHSNRGQAILKYLLVHKDQEVSRDVLMDIFWPEAGPQAARNNLNVAMHKLRQSFNTVDELPLLLYDKAKGTYRLNPELHLWLDVAEFDGHLKAARQLEAAGQLTHAVREYEIAASLYQGDFLADDLYEKWTVMMRERLRIAYLDLLDRLSQTYFTQSQYIACINLCQLILERDDCREDAHRRLMRCYSRQGQHHLALRQYQACVDALRSELEVEPEPATTRLHQQIRHHEWV